MNRAEKRRKAKEFSTPYKLNMLQNQLTAAIRKECEEDADRRVRTFIKDYTTLITYVLWYKFGIGKKRMQMFADELESHLDIIGNEKKYGLTIDDMYNELKNKAHIDLRILEDGNKIDKK